MFRPGLLDLAAAVLVAVALFIPAREFLVEPAYERASASELHAIARAQARLATHPGDGVTASELADTLRRIDMHQAALRVAGDALEHGGGWRAALAVSGVHADRVEVGPAYAYAQRALSECDTVPAECPAHERLRLSIYHDGLKAGIDSGVDPRLYPDRFRDEVRKAFRRVRSKPN